MVTLILFGTFIIACDVRPVRASGTIYILADGSIDPPTASIQRDGNNYTFTDNIYDSVVVERSYIRIDGAGYTLQGSGSGYGFNWTDINSVKVNNTSIKNFGCGVYLHNSSGNTISGNNITNNSNGVLLSNSSNSNDVEGNIIANNYHGVLFVNSSRFNTVSGNRITDNDYFGVSTGSSSNNNHVIGNNIIANNYGVHLYSSCEVYNNNFIDNNQQFYSSASTHIWWGGYPSGGNYWSDYTGVDVKNGANQDLLGSDGIGDTPYVIDSDFRDPYPLMKPYPWDSHDIGLTNLNVPKTVVGQGYTLHVNVMLFNYGTNTESFNVTVDTNGTVIGLFENITLNSRKSTTLTIHWDTTSFAKGNYIIDIHAPPVSGEIDISDNTFTGWVFVTIPGDVDGDRDVDIFDIVLMAGGYGKPPWGIYVNCDIDGDGDIDIFDIVRAAGNYGQSW
jgi:parallel beta-helix repeat protein